MLDSCLFNAGFEIATCYLTPFCIVLFLMRRLCYFDSCLYNVVFMFDVFCLCFFEEVIAVDWLISSTLKGSVIVLTLDL